MTTITTAAELDALPSGSVAAVINPSRKPASVWANAGGIWYQASDIRPWTSEEMTSVGVEFTVLYRPDQPSPTKPSAETAMAYDLGVQDGQRATTKPSVEDIIEAMVSAAPEVYAERGAVWFEAKAADVLSLIHI